MDLPFLMLVLLLTGIGVIMVFSASYATAYLQEDKSPTFYFFCLLYTSDAADE